jgi:hypothetical protein
MTGTLRPGERIRINEAATAGYYHVFIGKKYVGWVQQAALDLPRPEAERAQTPVAAAPISPAPPVHHEPPTSYLGLLGGLSLAAGQSNFGLALDGGYKLSKFWSLGMFFEYLKLLPNSASSSSASGSSSLASASTSNVNLILGAFELNYSIHRIPGLYVGAKVGLTMAMSNAVSTTTSTTAPGGNGVPVVGPPVVTPTTANTSTFGAVAGLGVGYDYPVIWTLSAGGEVNALFMTGDIASSVVNFLATVKYIF